MKAGYSVDKIHNLTKIDKWFLYKLQHLIDTEAELEQFDAIEKVPAALLRLAKEQGFSDFQIARSVLPDFAGSAEAANLKVRNYRKSLGIVPVVK